MKHLSVFFFLLLGCASTGYAQTAPLSLKACIELGIRNNLDLKNRRTDQLMSATTVTRSRARLLPVLTADLQMLDYLMRPANVTTGALLGNDFPDDPTWQKVQSMQYALTAGVHMSVPLYNQTLLATIGVAKTTQAMQEVSYEKAVADLTVQISRTYYVTQAAREHQRLLGENVERMEALCSISRALYDEGVILEVDLTRAEINLKSLTTQREYYATLYEQQLRLLRFLLDLDPSVPLAVETTDAEGFSSTPAAGVSASLPELRLLATQAEQIAGQIKTVWAEYLPSLSLHGQLGVVGYQEKLRHFFHTRNETHNWFGNSYIGLSLHIPLFDARDKQLRLRHLRLERRQVETSREELRKQLDKTYADAARKLHHYLDVLHTQRENYRQAENVYGVTEEKYREGVASMTELLQDEMRLREAQAACVEARLQCRMARLTLLQLAGCLDELHR